MKVILVVANKITLLTPADAVEVTGLEFLTFEISTMSNPTTCT